MGQALYRKWRPQTFDDVVGQEHIVQTLRNALRLGHIHHAYLFAGPRGTGKTTSARLVAKAVNCLAPVEARPCNECEICQAVNAGRLMDLIEIDAASNTGVDNVRDLLEKVGFRPMQSRYKVYVIDEVHMLSTAAFNALLKTLEEPPEHVIFILATTEAHKILPTVLSRCQRFEFRRIPLLAMMQQLQKIAASEGIQAEPEALELIARAATGSMRDAISLLDQMAADSTVTADYVRLMLGAERREVILELIQAWLTRDANAGLRTVNRAIDGGADPRQLARQLSDFLRGLLLMRLGAGETWTDPTVEERPRFSDLARQASPERLSEAVRLFSAVAAERVGGWQPQLPLELAFVEATLEPHASPSVASPSVALPSAAPPKSASSSPTASSPSAAAPPAAAPTPRRSATPQAAPAPQAPVSATSDALAASVAGRWGEVLDAMRPINLSLSALLRDAKPLGVDSEGRLVLGFRHAFHRGKVEEDAGRRAVEDVLAALFAQAIHVRCVLEKEWQPRPPAAPAIASASAPAPAHFVAPPEPPEEPPDDFDDEVARRAVAELGAVVEVNE